MHFQAAGSFSFPLICCIFCAQPKHSIVCPGPLFLWSRKLYFENLRCPRSLHPAQGYALVSLGEIPFSVQPMHTTSSVPSHMFQHIFVEGCRRFVQTASFAYPSLAFAVACSTHGVWSCERFYSLFRIACRAGVATLATHVRVSCCML